MSGEDRTVLTTGANSGIGLPTTLEVARRGFRSVGGVRSAAKAEVVAQAAADAGVEVWSRMTPTVMKDRVTRLLLDL